MYRMLSPPGFQFLSTISTANSASCGDLARSWRLSVCGRNEKNFRDVLTMIWSRFREEQVRSFVTQPMVAGGESCVVGGTLVNGCSWRDLSSRILPEDG